MNEQEATTHRWKYSDIIDRMVDDFNTQWFHKEQAFRKKYLVDEPVIYKNIFTKIDFDKLIPTINGVSNVILMEDPKNTLHVHAFIFIDYNNYINPILKNTIEMDIRNVLARHCLIQITWRIKIMIDHPDNYTRQTMANSVVYIDTFFNNPYNR